MGRNVLRAPSLLLRSSQDWRATLSASSTGWTVVPVVPGAAGPARSGAGVGTAPPLLGTRHPPCPQQPLGRGRTPPPLVLESACFVGFDGIVYSLMHAFASDWDSVWWLLFITEVSAGCSERCLWPAACIPVITLPCSQAISQRPLRSEFSWTSWVI